MKSAQIRELLMYESGRKCGRKWPKVAESGRKWPKVSYLRVTTGYCTADPKMTAFYQMLPPRRLILTGQLCLSYGYDSRYCDKPM